MPGLITITRGAAAPGMARSDVPQGAVFSVMQPGGRMGKKYAAIGANGRQYSVNIETQDLASAPNDTTKRVTLIGTWAFNIDRTFRFNDELGRSVGQEVLRKDVKPGQVFVVKGSNEEYVHIGRVTKARNGWLSVPLARQENHAVTSKGDSHVTIVGTARMAVTLAA